jgi:S-adenosylmethionine synthetase
LAKTGLIVLAGEITSKGRPDFVDIARKTAIGIGYDSADVGFDGNMCAVLTAIEPQSADISQGVTEGQGLHKEQGAGDQGLMFGFACDETPEGMPLPIAMAHRLMENLTVMRKSKKVDFLRPDAKSQVTVRYVDNRPVEVTAVVISTQHSPTVKYETIRESMIEDLIKKTIPAQYLTRNTVYHVNPTGSFVIGGPHGDCGLTARSSSIRTAATAVTAAAPFRAKTRARSIARPATWRGTSRRTSSRPDSRPNAKSRSLTRLAWPNRFRC